MRTILKWVIIKLLFGVMLVGTAVAQQSEIDAKVARLAHAIAATEGFYHKGTIPNRYHNPGDLRSRLKNAYEGQVGLNRSGYVIFKSDQFGWQALYQQIRKVLDDDSAYYNREMTFAQIAKVYATSPNWPKTLCKILKISPQLTFDEYFGLAPRVIFTWNSNADMLKNIVAPSVTSAEDANTFTLNGLMDFGVDALISNGGE